MAPSFLRRRLLYLHRGRPLAREQRVERRQLGGEYLLPAAHPARHPLTLYGKYAPRLLRRLAIGALHDGLESGQLFARAARRPRQAVGQLLEDGERCAGDSLWALMAREPSAWIRSVRHS